MNKIEKIKSHFKEINKIFWENENNHKYLRVELNVKDLNSVENISKEISKYIDELSFTDDNYFLDIYSSGTEQQIDLKNIDKYINENLIVNFKSSIQEKKGVEGELIKIENDKVFIKWNNKGRFQKFEIDKINILNIFLSAKITKEKK